MVDPISILRDPCIFDFAKDFEYGVPRYPNKYELRYYAKRMLKCIYFNQPTTMAEQYHRPYPMSRNTYYTFKGQIWRNQLYPFLNYIEKRGYDGIKISFEKYKNSKCIQDISYIPKPGIPAVHFTRVMFEEIK